MKYLLLVSILILLGCQTRQPDVLDDLGQAVLKSKRGLTINIESEEEKK